MSSSCAVKKSATVVRRLAGNHLRQILAVNQIPTDQVTFLSLGGGDVSYMSLRAGVIDAVMLQFPNTFLAQDEGFRKIAAGADYYRAVQGGLTATKALITEKPEVVTKVVRATLRAVRLLKSDKKYGLEVLTKKSYVELGKERERFAERAYEAATQGYLALGSGRRKVTAGDDQSGCPTAQAAAAGRAGAGLRFQLRAQSGRGH